MTRLEKQLKDLPKSPGVYFYKNKAGEIIYIGKAANLKNRVSQYFQKSRTRDAKTDALITEIADLDIMTVDSELDALFLEAEMVRRYMPRYNILLRDDKSMVYIRIDYGSDYPTVGTSRRPLDDGAKYFGPYLSTMSVRQALKILRRIFPFATRRLPGQKRASLHYHLGLDPGLEDGKTTLVEYRANLRKLISVIEGKRKSIEREVEKEMKRAARAKDFEYASQKRNQLFALQRLSKQMIFSDKENQDLSKDQALIELAELLDLYDDIPQSSHLDGVQENNEVRASRTNVTVSESRKQLTQQSAKSSAGVTGSTGRQGRTLRTLRRIEGYDISHMSGTDVVASMAVFTNGVSNKAEYRKFKTRKNQNDDFYNMFETIKRRLSDKNLKTWGMPDVLLIDGGKGQVNAALKAMKEMNIVIPAIGLAKRFEQIILPKLGGGMEVVDLPPTSHLIKLLQRIRDESHRFAVSYHSSLKQKRQTASLLDDIPGIGPATRKKLIRAFGSLRGVTSADQEMLIKVVGTNKAEKLKMLDTQKNH